MKVLYTAKRNYSGDGVELHANHDPFIVDLEPGKAEQVMHDFPELFKPLPVRKVIKKVVKKVKNK